MSVRASPQGIFELYLDLYKKSVIERFKIYRDLFGEICNQEIETSRLYTGYPTVYDFLQQNE